VAGRVPGRLLRAITRATLFTCLVLLGIRSGAAVRRLGSGRPAPELVWGDRAWVRAGAGVYAPWAGVSAAARPDIRPLRSGRLGRLTESAGYHAFRHRCSSCHTPPDPAMHTLGEWRGIVRRMGEWMDAAGVMPMAPADTAAIGAFLERAAASRRH